MTVVFPRERIRPFSRQLPVAPFHRLRALTPPSMAAFPPVGRRALRVRILLTKKVYTLKDINLFPQGEFEPPQADPENPNRESLQTSILFYEPI
jgi:hypothetical protein